MSHNYPQYGIRMHPDLRKQAEDVLRPGEPLSQLIVDMLWNVIEERKSMKGRNDELEALKRELEALKYRVDKLEGIKGGID